MLEGLEGCFQAASSGRDVIAQMFSHHISETCCLWEVTFLPKGRWWGPKPPALPGQRPVPTEGVPRVQAVGSHGAPAAVQVFRGLMAAWLLRALGLPSRGPGPGGPLHLLPGTGLVFPLPLRGVYYVQTANCNVI